MPAAVRSAFEVAYWFIDRARQAGVRIAPLHLQQLLYLAQVSYASVHGGQTLMPAVFVADELGPLEPNVHAALSAATPKITLDGVMPVAVEALLQRVWRLHGGDPETLLRLTTHSPAYREARDRGLREPIALAAMATATAADDQGTAPCSGESARMLRTQTGRPVRVGAWLPKTQAVQTQAEAGASREDVLRKI